MGAMLVVLAFLSVPVAWVGHACICTAVLNYVYGCALPKLILRPWRYITALLILGFPFLLAAGRTELLRRASHDLTTDPQDNIATLTLLVYYFACVGLGAAFPAITVRRYRQKPPACLIAETTRTLDFWPECGQELVGNGKNRLAVWIPGNGAFKFDLTALTLALPHLPKEWDGLTVLVLSDLHFHGTPSQAYFDRAIDEILAGPVPDLVCLPGDFVDTVAHHAWIGPILGKLKATGAKLAVLGNHDEARRPEGVRAALTDAGYTVLGNRWCEITIRGLPCVAIGHEGPWFRPAPNLEAAPVGPFRICVSHTPDNFYWAQAHGVGFMVSGHVHGGAIRVPLIGSIFVPSIYGRRFDQGVFEENGTAMVVSRGVSGKEPLRFRCNPQAIFVTLRAGSVPHTAG